MSPTEITNKTKKKEIWTKGISKNKPLNITEPRLAKSAEKHETQQFH